MSNNINAIKYSERTKQMMELYNEGKTYEEIGNKFGITKQRVYSYLGKRKDCLFRTIKPEQCIYKGIRNWMNENRISFSELPRLIYGHSNPNQRLQVKERLNGSVNFRKDFIDQVLRLTNLTYEVAFDKSKEL